MKFAKDKIKNLIGEEAYKKLQAEMGDKDFYLLDPKDYIPKETFNATNSELQTLKTEKEKINADLTAANEEVKKLKSDNSNKDKTVEQKLEEFNKKIAALEDSGKQKDAELLKERKLSLLKTSLVEQKANPKYMKFLVNEIPLDKLEIENDKIKGFDDLLKPVKEGYPNFFGEEKFAGEEIDGGSDKDKKDVKEQTTEEFLSDVFNDSK